VDATGEGVAAKAGFVGSAGMVGFFGEAAGANVGADGEG
jgi:hypothetical protein